MYNAGTSTACRRYPPTHVIGNANTPREGSNRASEGAPLTARFCRAPRLQWQNWQCMGIMHRKSTTSVSLTNNGKPEGTNQSTNQQSATAAEECCRTQEQVAERRTARFRLSSPATIVIAGSSRIMGRWRASAPAGCRRHKVPARPVINRRNQVMHVGRQQQASPNGIIVITRRTGKQTERNQRQQ